MRGLGQKTTAPFEVDHAMYDRLGEGKILKHVMVLGKGRA
jgi:hypothetical protein